ncbi:MAG TPA: hypothetical protein PLF61_07630 [Candidatus Goldiibacteriota bacterium]|nr:hypothetical protein [Candidatus Goldiibacteriota bacterium]
MKRTLKSKHVYSSACVNCGKLIEEGSEIIINGKNYCDACSVIKDKNATTEFNPQINAPDCILKFFSYILSLFNPFIGFVFGAIFYPQKQNNKARAFGKNCLILMAISIVFVLLFLVLSAGMTGTNILSGIKEGYY